MAEASEQVDGIDIERTVFDMREGRLRFGVVASGGSQEEISALAKGDQFEIDRLTGLYKDAALEVAHIRRSFEHHGIIEDLQSAIGDNELTHLAWQWALDMDERKTRAKKMTKFTPGPVATQLVDSLLMAIKLPKIVQEAENGAWVDLGSGTGMAAITMAMCGRRVVGIERDPASLNQSIENQRQVEALIVKKLPLEFMAGTLPERGRDPIEPELREILNDAFVWYSYPWPSELDARVRLFRKFAKRSASLILYTAEDPVTYTVEEIRNKGLIPVELPSGKLVEELGLSENSWWTVWKK